MGYGQVKVNVGYETKEITNCEDKLIEKGYATDQKFIGWITYVVSAPLSSKGSAYFWPMNNACGIVAALVDVLFHVCLWLAILIMDCWVAHLPNRDEDSHSIGDAYAQEIQWGGLVCTILVWAGLVISIAFGVMGQIPGAAWPSTVALLRGGAIGGIVFHSLYALKIMAMTGGGATGMHNNWNIVVAEPKITVRQLTLWTVGLKCLAFACLDANLNFFGPVKEAELANVCSLAGKNYGVRDAVSKEIPPP